MEAKGFDSDLQLALQTFGFYSIKTRWMQPIWKDLLIMQMRIYLVVSVN